MIGIILNDHFWCFFHRTPFKELTIILEKKAGGRLLERLLELEATGFIQKIPVFGKKREHLYKVIDEYSLFYLKWIDGKTDPIKGADTFSKIRKSPSYISWSGYSFEGVCYKHAYKIIEKLNIQNVVTTMGQWTSKNWHDKSQDGAQIDLIFDRDDDAMTLCEIKHTEVPFIINKDVAKNLSKKIDVFKESTKTRKQLFVVFITSNGLKENVWSEELVNGVVTLDDIF